MLACRTAMRVFSALRTGFVITGVLLAAMSLPAQEVSKESPSTSKGMPPRAGPSDYQAQAKAGDVTIGAEFMGHAVPTPEQTLSADDYIVVEAGLFGPSGAKTTLARSDFSLRVNGKKTALPSEPYELVFKSLKDPEWQPPVDKDDSKSSKSSITTGGGGGGGGNQPPPLPPKMPFELRRAMELHVQKAVMEEGDRALPQAGLLFFLYQGKREGIHSLELIYSGAAGSATLTLEP